MGAKGKNQVVDEPVVVCDFRKVTRRWGREWLKLDGEMQQWSAVLTEPQRDDLSDEELATLRAGRLEAHVKINELVDRRDELAAQVIVSVPREWLVEDAPEDIDWSNPENLLDYVRDVHSNDLLRGITLARAAEAKN